MISMLADTTAQREINFYNPSFEDTPQHSKPPAGWTDCGPPTETPPDVHPGNFFSVTAPPYHGNTYVGMVVRNDDTWESIAQRLPAPLRRGECYNMSAALMRSPVYVSHNRKTGQRENYTTPIKLRIWGGTSMCDRRILLAESPLIENTQWRTFEFTFNPQTDVQFIMLEAYYRTPVFLPYNGNILVDNLSSIRTCDFPEIAMDTAVEEDEPVAEENIPPAELARSPSTPTPPPTHPRPEVQETIMPELDTRTIREGVSLPVNRLSFQVDSFNINAESEPVLKEIAGFLKSNPGIVVEIGGHTNSLCDDEFCNWLSRERAKSVAEFIVAQGVEGDRVYFRGYGKSRPIASNRTPDGRIRNQRVEIKILQIR